MADIFMKFDAISLLKEKFILLLGDSNMSLIYNDLIYLLLNNCITSPQLLRGRSKKKWDSYLGDEVVRLSSYETAGRGYFKEREYKKDNLHVRYHFVTKVSGEEMNHTLNGIEKEEIPYPDIVVVNSCMWDVTRWGPMREDDYKNDLIKFFSRLKKILPDDTLIIWTSTLPISTNFTKGGVLIQQLEFMKYSLRFMILEANKFTQQLCMAFGIDFLDLHYHMRFQLHRRSVDGIHWEPQAARHIVCIILTHIATALQVPLPGRVGNKYLQNCVEKPTEENAEAEIDFNSLNLERNIVEKIKEEKRKICEVKQPIRKRKTTNQINTKSSKEVSGNPTEVSNPGERVKKKGKRMYPAKNKNWEINSRSSIDLRETLHNNTASVSGRSRSSMFSSDNPQTAPSFPMNFNFGPTYKVPPWVSRNFESAPYEASSWKPRNTEFVPKGPNVSNAFDTNWRFDNQYSFIRF